MDDGKKLPYIMVLVTSVSIYTINMASRRDPVLHRALSVHFVAWRRFQAFKDHDTSDRGIMVRT